MAIAQTHATFSIPGELKVGARPARFYVEHPWLLTHARASVGTPPQGSAIVVDVLKGDGTSVLPAPLRIAATKFSDVSVLSQSLVAGNRITVDIQQVGSEFPGADATVTLWMQRTV